MTTLKGMAMMLKDWLISGWPVNKVVSIGQQDGAWPKASFRSGSSTINGPRITRRIIRYQSDEINTNKPSYSIDSEKNIKSIQFEYKVMYTDNPGDITT